MAADSLLDAARVDLEYAAFGLDSGDDGYIGVAGFHIQQAVEKTLKSVLRYFGIPYKKTRDIGSLLGQLGDKTSWISDELWDSLSVAAPLLNTWESRPRYNEESGYLVARRTALKYYELAKELRHAAVAVVEDVKTEDTLVPSLSPLELE